MAVEFSPPSWWHIHGFKIDPELVAQGPFGPSMKLKSKVAEMNAYCLLYMEAGWRISWKIMHDAGRDNFSGGSRLFQDRQLKIAFNLDERREEDFDWLAEKYSASVAHQGLYIRRQSWLNIPGPGTGLDGDPNLSIFVDDEIQNAVRQLLSLPRRSIQDSPGFAQEFKARAAAEYQE